MAWTRALVNPFYLMERIKHHGPKRLLLGTVKRHPRGVAAMRRVIQSAVVVRHPIEYSERASLGRHMLAHSKWRGTVPHDTGYAFVPPGTIPGADEVWRYCRDTYDKWKASESERSKSREKEFRYVELFSKDGFDGKRNGAIADFNEHPIIQDFVLGREMAEIATDYLGKVPVLATAQLTLTTPNNSQVGPQNFHIDWGADRELQLFMSITDIDDATGPLSFFPAHVSKQLTDQLNFDGQKLSDETVYGVLPREHLIQGKSKAGTSLFIDTRRCVHYGSRGNHKDRLVLIVKYITRFSSSDHNNALGLLRFNRAGIKERYQHLLVNC